MRLSLAEASRLCMNDCRAQCCRGPQYLALGADEVAPFERHGGALGVAVRVTAERHVRFLDHAGEHCPMLDDATSACRIYAERPRRCRAFPDKPRAGCELSVLEVG